MSIPKNFQAAETFLSRRNVRTVKGKRATQVVRLGPDEIALRYHGTSVVTWKRDGDVILRSNGFRTVTTKARINDATPVRVWQRNFEWWVTASPGANPEPFEEGMIVRA